MANRYDRVEISDRSRFKQSNMADMSSMWKVYNEPNSIKLPESMEVFGDLNNGKRFAIDIGCSLTKIAYYSATKHKQCSYNHRRKNESHASKSNTTDSQKGESSTLSKLSVDRSNPAKEDENKVEHNNESTSQKCSKKNCEVGQMSHLHFVKFQTKYIENCLDFIENHLIGNKELVKGNTIKVTGGGVCKYAGCIKEKLGVLIDKEDELGCLIKGTNFLLKNVAKEAFIFQRNRNPEYVFENVDSELYPYLFVNIGSGVSIIKVTGEESYKRIGGLSTGGATFWGLGSLLTSAKEYDELLELAENGDYRKVDMLVRDLIGSDYSSIGLSGDLIAASFGKINFTNGDASQRKFSEADIARSLLFTVLNSIGQVASLYAMMHTVNKIYFGGYFLRNNPLSMEVLSLSVNYWSDNKFKALFLRHEGYLGTIGAFLKGTEQWAKDGGKKYSESGLAFSSGKTNKSSDQSESFACCPLLRNPNGYQPDTVDLVKDEEAREYWLECFKDTVEKFAKKAAESQPESATAKKRAEMFREKTLSRLRQLKGNPSACGILTVRTLLDTMGRFLEEFDFPDPYLEQKQLENRDALALFADHISDLDALDEEIRQRKLLVYLLAGNVFDWGAKEVSALLGTTNFGFKEALQKIPERPWLVDHVDDWLERMRGPPHKCAVVFVDNSGLDIVLGVFPFVRELLRRGTEVILCSNSAAALNDVTHKELLGILEEIRRLCPVLNEALEKKSLIAMETGQTGPCLDLSHLSRSLCEEMLKRRADLVVIEGMGRSVHTNLCTWFTCDSLKLAVIKNRWLAQRLGGDMFCVICQYQRGSAS